MAATQAAQAAARTAAQVVAVQTAAQSGAASVAASTEDRSRFLSNDGSPPSEGFVGSDPVGTGDLCAGVGGPEHFALEDSEQEGRAASEQERLVRQLEQEELELERQRQEREEREREEREREERNRAIVSATVKDLVLQSTDRNDASKSLNMLFLIFENLRKHPDAEKYRKVG